MGIELIQRWKDAVAGTPAGESRIADWSLHFAETRRLSLPTRDGETGNAHMPLTLSESCAARYVIVWSDGLVSRGALERRQLEGDLARALAEARRGAYRDPDAAQVMGPAELPEVELHSAEVAAIAGGDVRPLLDRVARIRRCAADAGPSTWSGTFHATDARSELETSLGFRGSSRGTHWSWHVSLRGEIGTGHASRGLEPVEDLEERARRIAVLAPLLDVAAADVRGGTRPVLLHPDVVEELVLGALLHQLDAATVAHGESWFRREQLGAPDPVLREDLTIRIDPTLPMRAGSYRFTAEGVPAAACTFVERGRVIRPSADLKYARRLGVPATPLPSGSDTTFIEGPPRIDLGHACDAVPDGALVLAVLGVHTLDAASGDFSLSAPQTMQIRGGKPVARYRATLSGNLLTLLRSEDLQLVAFPGEPLPGILATCRLDPK